MRKFVALLAVAVTAGCASSGRSAVVGPNPAGGSSSSSASTAVPTTSHRLWLLADGAAKANGGSVLRAEAVQSTHAAAVQATMGDGVEGDQPVWVVQVQGRKDFVCLRCSHPAGATAPSGRYLLLVLDATTFRETDFGIDPKAVDLSRLGLVVALHD